MRSFRNQKHLFMTLMGTTLLSSLSWIDSFSGFSDFTEAHIEMLKNYFVLSMSRRRSAFSLVCNIRFHTLQITTF